MVRGDTIVDSSDFTRFRSKFSDGGWNLLSSDLIGELRFLTVIQLNVQIRTPLSTPAILSDFDRNRLVFDRKNFLAAIKAFYSQIWSENSDFRLILNIPSHGEKKLWTWGKETSFDHVLIELNVYPSQLFTI